MLLKNKIKTEQIPLLFFSFACPKEKNQKKKTPGSLACGYPCKIAFRGVAGNSLRSNSPATSPPALQFCSAALHGIKDRGRTTIKTDWWRVWDRKVASGSLIASYYHVSFGAKARANSLCEFFAIIDMLSKTDFWILMAESVYAVFPGRFHYRCHGHS